MRQQQGAAQNGSGKALVRLHKKLFRNRLSYLHQVNKQN